MTEAIDPVKRTIVRIPRLVKPQGRLRWIGDALVNTVCFFLAIFYLYVKFRLAKSLLTFIILTFSTFSFELGIKSQ